MRELLLSLFAIIAAAVATAGVASGDEEDVCQDLRLRMVSAPTPNYDHTMRILMDSWNYQNLLGNRDGVVWQQVDNNTSQLTTNVSVCTLLFH